ncbi:MAG: HlyD family secretion protein, partial [Sphingomonas sp.]|nr:HlyD family secretion protein [Sphingomonas sp.]
MSDDTKPEPAADQPDTDTHEDGKKAKDATPIYRRPFFWVLILVAGVAVVGGTLYYMHSRQFEATDDAFVDAHIVRIAPEVAGTLIDVA